MQFYFSIARLPEIAAAPPELRDQMRATATRKAWTHWQTWLGLASIAPLEIVGRELFPGGWIVGIVIGAVIFSQVLVRMGRRHLRMETQ